MDHQRDGFDVSIHQTLFATYDNPMIVVDSADFDGTNDYMTRGAGLTGAVDSKSGIFAAWARMDGGDGAVRSIISATTVGGLFFIVDRTPLNKFLVQGMNAAGTIILSLPTVNSYVASATWRGILSSWNLATGAGHLYISDASDLGTTILTDDTVDYTYTDWFIGANTAAGLEKMNGALAEVYFAPGQYLDFSLVANRRKFISASGKPVHLGSTGALPTGTAPLVYQHLDDAEAVANFATNRGTGGNFTITGTLDTGSTSPSD